MKRSLRTGVASLVLPVAAGSLVMVDGAHTIAVEPGESVQEAIDGASPGDVVCLSLGEWEENLLIEKSLTLRAAEIEPEPEVEVQSARAGWPMILITSEELIEVTIQGLKVTGAFGDCSEGGPDGYVLLAFQSTARQEW